jgi:Tfp pilus assembly protein PilF
VASLIAVDADRMDEAQALADAALKGRPDQMEALLTRGTLAVGELEAGQAASAFQGALRANPDDGRSWSGLGFAQMLSGELGLAQESFRKAVTHMQNHVATWLAFGWSLVLDGKAVEARRVFEKAVELDRAFPESHGGLAVALARLGERELAQHEIEVATRLDGDNMSALYARTVLEGKAEDPGAILGLVRKIRLHRPDAGIAKAEQILEGAARKGS